MSQGLVERQNIEDIADAIRSKNGSSDTYTPAEMAQAISGIHTADEVVLVQKTVNANGQYNASDDSADGYSGVRVNVQNSYSASDEGKVVSNGDLVAQTTKQITANGTHDTTTNNSVAVNVPNSYATSDNGKVVVNQELVAQTSKNINTNGTHDTTSNNSVVVDVPNSYAAADEGKVVSGGALVNQTSRNVTVNGTYDTTNNNEVVVNVPTGGGSGTLIPKTVTQNGTYNASDDNADGYSSVTVNVSGGGSGSDNDILFHFDNSFKNSGNRDALFYNITGLEISDEQSKFGGTSLKTGSSQVIRNAYLSYDFQFGSNDFTVDFWCYPTNLVNHSSGFKVPIAFPYRSLAFYLATDMMEFGISKNASSWFNTDDVPVIIDNNQWHHIALVRNGTNVYGYLNGVKVKTIDFGNDSWASLNEHTITVGSNTYSNGDRRFVGYIDEFRVKIGEAVWTDDFTPPTTPYE